jgi:cell division protein FtsN
MARDYAQGSRNRRPQTQQKGALPAWAWLVFGLSIGLAVAAFVYISRPAGSRDTPAVAEAASKNAPAKKAGRIALPPEEKERFTFYKDLKKQQVYIPRDERPAAKKPAAAEDLYLIQVASFRAVSDAEREKASLALLGLQARIEKVTVDDQDTYFRVRIGPMGTASAQTTLARLQENGIQGMVVKAN